VKGKEYWNKLEEDSVREAIRRRKKENERTKKVMRGRMMLGEVVDR